MMNKKAHSLATLYRDMPTPEMERRLAHADLAEVARSVATEELLRRQAEPTVATPPVVERNLDTLPGDGPRSSARWLGYSCERRLPDCSFLAFLCPPWQH